MAAGAKAPDLVKGLMVRLKPCPFERGPLINPDEEKFHTKDAKFARRVFARDRVVCRNQLKPRAKSQEQEQEQEQKAKI